MTRIKIHIPRRVRRILIPVGWLFGQITRLRRFCYRKGIFHSRKADVPTINVGNIAVGGTGKTPHVEYLLSLLKENHQPALLSRGYGRNTHGYVFANSNEESLTAECIGDEPLLLHSIHPELPLAVDGNRLEGIRKLCLDAPDTDIIILDDAFQHLSLKADINIVLTEYSWPYYQDYPMPAGRLREFPSAIADADMVIVTKTTADPQTIQKEAWRQRLQLTPQQPLFFTSYQYLAPIPVTPAAQSFSTENVTDILLVTGIGHSQPMVDYLESQFHIVNHIQYADHQRYTLADIRHIQQTYDSIGRQLPILTTEKDWMRIQDKVLKKSVSSLPIFILPIMVQFIFEEEKLNFNRIIQQLC